MSDVNNPGQPNEAAPQAPARSAAQIQADLEASRLALTRSIDELSSKLDPRTQVREAGEKAQQAFADVRGKAEDLVEDVRAGEPKALRIAGGIVAGLVAIVGFSLWRRRK